MKTNDTITQTTNYLSEIEDTNKMCALLLKTKYYSDIGSTGVFSIIQTAKSLGINPIQALQGGLYYFKGKIEMSARMMGALIRSRGHSFTISKIDNTTCTINGKRIDSKDSMAATFTMDEAKNAGLNSIPWKIYPQDMLYARALSRLARRLFPDIIGNCYVEGEINTDKPTNHNDNHNDTQIVGAVTIESDRRTEQEVTDLLDVFNVVPDYKKKIELFLRKNDILELSDMPKEMYSKVLKAAKVKVQEYMAILQDKFSGELEVVNG
jgi:hypothetical protein